MAYDGFRIVGYDGTSAQGGVWNELRAPPTIEGVRPDAWGSDGVCIAFAEAKTASDIDTEHTRIQLRMFARLREESPGARCRVYLAIPRSTAHLLDRVLREVGLIGAADIVRLHVPDILLRGAA
jgi:hypothetical protein